MEKQYQEECGIKNVAVVDGYRDFIFINRFGNVQHQGTLNKALRRIIRDCNYEVLDKNSSDDAVILPKFSNHSLRHTFTTRMCEAGVNIKAMQEILGHADAETTMDIYAEATKDLKKAELINFEEYFERVKKKSNSSKILDSERRKITIKDFLQWVIEHKDYAQLYSSMIATGALIFSIISFFVSKKRANKDK